MTETKVAEQLQIIYQSLFSKESLRKNVYIFQHLTPEMLIKIKFVQQQRHIAAITTNPSLIIETLKACSLVEVIDDCYIRVLARGQPVIVMVKSSQNKKLPVGELKKLLHPLTKDIRHEIKDFKNKVEYEFQSEAAVTEFVERIKTKNLPVIYEVKQKDIYECLKLCIKNLRKQRKNQQQAIQENQRKYQFAFMPPQLRQYQVFIRKAVVSSDDEQREQEKEEERDFKEESKQLETKLDSQDFPGL